jgi:multidrug efflux pump subunit AcrA (membrane-fusion protein)
MNCLNARTRPRRALLPLLALTAALLVAGGCGKEEKKEAARPPTEVTALTVTPRDVPIASVFVAQTQSSQAVNIAARVSGFLDQRVYTEGAVVKAGQVLFRMDPKPFQAQVDSAQLDLSYTTIASPVDGVSSFAAVADGTYVNAQNSLLTTVFQRLSEAAQASMLATDETRRGVILSLVSTVAINYIALRGLDEQLAISRRTLATYGESVRLYQLQFRYGQTSQMTVSQAQSQYESAAVQIPQIESQIGETENALSILLGRNPGPIPHGGPADGQCRPVHGRARHQTAGVLTRSFRRATSSRDYFGSCVAARSRASSATIPLNAADIAAA